MTVPCVFEERDGLRRNVTLSIPIHITPLPPQRNPQGCYEGGSWSFICSNAFWPQNTYFPSYAYMGKCIIIHRQIICPCNARVLLTPLHTFHSLRIHYSLLVKLSLKQHISMPLFILVIFCQVPSILSVSDLVCPVFRTEIKFYSFNKAFASLPSPLVRFSRNIHSTNVYPFPASCQVPRQALCIQI